MAYEQSGEGAGKAFLDTDGRGNVANVVGTDGELDCAVVYDPFGQPREPGGNGVCASGVSVAAAGATGNAQWYRGQTRNGSTGDYQLGTRTYNPANGAFSTPDAYRVSTPGTDLSVGTDPLTANTYTYVNGNPVNMYDPDGHAMTCSDDSDGRCAEFDGKGNITKRFTPKKTNAAGRPYKKWELERLNEGEVDAAESAIEREEKKANEEFDWVGLAVSIAGDVTGVTDIKNCVMEGDAMACAMSVAGIVGASIFKLGKLVKRVASAISDYRKFNRARSAAQGRLGTLRSNLADLKAEGRAIAKQADSPPRASKATTSKPTARSEAPAREKGTTTKTDEIEGQCRLANSFSGDTLVLMGDKRTRKPISEIKVGDEVWAADPETGQAAARGVTHVWEHRDTMVDLTVDGEVITTTEDHPFWSESAKAFVDAEELKPGHMVQSADRTKLRSRGINWGSAQGGLAYNLTVADFSTYHVGTGHVLVHNCGRATVMLGQQGETAVREAFDIGLRNQATSINGNWRIFDGLNEQAVSEVKNVSRLSNTSQIRDLTDFALVKDIRLDIYVRAGTKISKPLVRAHFDPDNPVNIIRYLP